MRKRKARVRACMHVRTPNLAALAGEDWAALSGRPRKAIAASTNAGLKIAQPGRAQRLTSDPRPRRGTRACAARTSLDPYHG